LSATFQAQTSLTLHSPSDSIRPWAGVATNIVDHGTGVQSFYALRVGQKADCLCLIATGHALFAGWSSKPAPGGSRS
jgi:hypothetical protein